MIRSFLLNRATRDSLLAILCLTPLLIWNSMMWDFYKPKELFLQFSVFATLCLQFARPSTHIKVNLLDIAVVAGFLVLVVFAFLPGRTGNSSSSLNIPFHVAIFYLLLQMSDFRRLDSLLRYFKVASRLIALTGMIMAIYGIMQYYHLDVFHPRGVATFGPKVVSTMGHANAFGGFLAAIFPFALYNASQTTDRGEKAIHALVAGVLLLALMLTISRGSWVALAGSLIIFNFSRLKSLWQRHLKAWSWRIAATVILIIGAIIALWFVFQINPDSVTGRFFIWRITGEMISDHPIAGIGYNRYGVEYLNYQAGFFDDPANSIHFYRAANLKQADNEYLQILAETGLVGFTLFILFLAAIYITAYHVLKATRKKTKERKIVLALAASITVVLLHSLVDNPLRNLPTQLVFYFTIGMISHMAKQLGLFPLLLRYRFSFRNNSVLLLVALALLVYSTYNVVLKGKGYLHWQNGQNLVAQGDWHHGIEEYERARATLSWSGELKFHLGAAYAYTRQAEEVIPLLDDAKGDFNDKNIYIVEGSAFLQLGQNDAAEQSFITVIRMYPELLLPRLWLAEMYLSTGRNDEAISRLNEIIAIQPKIMTAEAVSIKEDAKRLLRFVEDEG